MQKTLLILFVVSLLFVCSFSIFAQTPPQIDQELVTALVEINKYSAYGGNHEEEKLEQSNRTFAEKILKFTKIPATLNYKFTQLGDKMHITTSADGKFRIYAWDTQDGGTMHFFSHIYQYLGADGKVYSQAEAETEEFDAGGFTNDIFMLDTKAGRVYIVTWTGIGSISDNYQEAALYRIEGDRLNDQIKLIKTKSGLTNSLGFEYNFFSVAKVPDRPIKLIHFDQKTKTLRIPVVVNTKKYPNGQVTNKFISYRFDGTYFVKVS